MSNPPPADPSSEPQADVEREERPKMDDRYEVAAWMTVAGAGLMALNGVFGMILSLFGNSYFMITPVTTVTTIAEVICYTYGFIWFKRFLNNRFDFHGVDTLIILLIIGSVLTSAIAVVFRISLGAVLEGHMSRPESLALILPFLIAIFAIAVPMSIFGIIFGVRLLRLKDPVYGYLKPLAYTQIIGYSMMLTVILSPLGGLVLLAGVIIQAMILFKAAGPEPAPEFV